MFKRKNKITALLVAAASIMSIVPAMASDTTATRLTTNNGNITNAIAYSNGKYIYQGYKSSDDTDAVYYNDGNKDKALDNLSNATLNTEYKNKYAFTNDGSTQYLVDLTNGDVTDSTTPSDDIDTAATKLQTKLNKASRYKKTTNISVNTSDLENGQTASDKDSTLFTIPGSKLGDSWYSYAVKPNSSDADKYVGSDNKLYGFTDDSGKYIDASYTANIYAYSTTEGKTVKISNYSKQAGDQDSDSKLLATLIQQPVALTQDKDYIYALATVAITDFGTSANVTGGTTTSAVANVPSFSDGVTTVRTYIQKISKAQGDQKDDAYLPKTVESYEVGNYITNGYSGKTEYDCSDAHDAYQAILTTLSDANHSVSNLTDVTQEDVVVRTDNGEVKPLFTVNNGNLVAIEATDSKVDAFTLKFKKDKVKFLTFPGYKGTASTTVAAASNFDTNNKVDVYMLEKDSDDSVDLNNGNGVSGNLSYDIDVDGNAWVVADGKIYEYKAGGSMTKVYTCDSSLDSISAYDSNNIVAWKANGDVYTTVNGNAADNSATTTAGATTTAKVGWDKLADGTWNFYDATGNKVVNNWVNIGGVWYFLKADGVMATGWINANGTWYYLKSSGAMATGWVNDNGTWYYLNASGAMATGWINDNGTWYYLNASGAMLANTTVDGYVLGSSGAWIQ
ncbi:N-acetylmuramoyl-L-alanine amidase family protein [Clostridium beijerinckii]|uniref:N-acetylmuramoyl-L-alanine amidase family protein n=1 Tax=Clostridium beijerinckii TaxID=1520 RepID=UPI000478BD4A|nr:N-acetylmuramoyl-L-alanine amidase family protein [Clostridium beijerinckii]